MAPARPAQAAQGAVGSGRGNGLTATKALRASGTYCAPSGSEPGAGARDIGRGFWGLRGDPGGDQRGGRHTLASDRRAGLGVRASRGDLGSPEPGVPRQSGSHLPVQGLHAGLPGASGRAPGDPRRPPATRGSRARTSTVFATRRCRCRRRWPVHGVPSSPPPWGNLSQEGSGAQKVSPRASYAAICSSPV